MLFHRGNICSGLLYVDLTHMFKLQANLNVTSGGLKINNTNFVMLNSRSGLIVPVFSCSSCGKTDLTTEEISFQCRNCGRKIHIINAVMPSDSGGLFCTRCGEHYLNHGETNVFNLDLLKTLKFSHQ